MLEMLKLIHAALGYPDVSPCAPADVDRSNTITIDELVAAAINAATQCAALGKVVTPGR